MGDHATTDQGPANEPSAQPSPIPVGVLCPDCGYDLRGSTSDRCPECGFSLDLLRARETLIPWSHRRELGRFRAYWKTVRLVTLRPRQFCVEACRPVSYRDSQAFRWVTAVHAYPPLVFGVLGLYAISMSAARPAPATLQLAAGVGLIGLLLLLIMLPGLASYFFQPRWLSIEQQNRAIALSYYAWAPLAWTPLGLVLLPLMAVPSPLGLGNAPVVLALCAIGLFCVPAVVLCEMRLFQSFRHVLYLSSMRSTLRLFWLNVLGLVLIGLILFVLFGVLYVWLVFHTTF